VHHTGFRPVSIAIAFCAILPDKPEKPVPLPVLHVRHGLLAEVLKHLVDIPYPVWPSIGPERRGPRDLDSRVPVVADKPDVHFHTAKNDHIAFERKLLCFFFGCINDNFLQVFHDVSLLVVTGILFHIPPKRKGSVVPVHILRRRGDPIAPRQGSGMYCPSSCPDFRLSN
jgi:hypothetical protein